MTHPKREEIAIPPKDHLSKELQKVIDYIEDPEQKKEAYSILSSEITFTRTFIGPLPCAEEMALYEKTHSGSAERIIAMAENQQTHRIEMEKMDFPIRNCQFKMGQWFIFIIGICGLGITALLALMGHDWVAGIIGTVTIGTILTCLVKHKIQD